MPIVPFGEYRPDVSDFNGQTTKNVLNAVPKGDGYGPFPSFAVFSATLGSACRGHFYARKADGTVQSFAGTSTQLYTLNNSALTWTPISSSTASGYSALDATANWEFAQFNNLVFATQANIKPLFYSLTTSTAWATSTSTSIPQAAHIAVVNRFLVLSGIASPNVYRLQWSGLNDTTNWVSGVNGSDFQDLPDGGIVRGVVGGDVGYIFQDTSIRRMTFAPGSPYTFGIDRISLDDGLMAPGSLVAAGDRIFYFSPTGFKMIPPGGYPTPIGKEKVDRTFLSDVDLNNLQLFIGAHDPRQTRVYWAYKSNNTALSVFDTILVYDWVLDKWAKISAMGEYISSLARPSVLTLDNLDTAFGTNIDTISLGSLDDITNSAVASLCAFDSNHALGFFSGDNLEATLETPEQGGDDQRIYVNGVRPICDATNIFVSISKRETPQAVATYSNETMADAFQGVAPARVSTRYARAKVRVQAADTWTYAAGVEPKVGQEGER
jgi:hypothetical protein